MKRSIIVAGILVAVGIGAGAYYATRGNGTPAGTAAGAGGRRRRARRRSGRLRGLWRLRRRRAAHADDR
jgi:hypothetical protein